MIFITSLGSNRGGRFQFEQEIIKLYFNVALHKLYQHAGYIVRSSTALFTSNKYCKLELIALRIISYLKH